MKLALALFGLAALGLILQGALGTFLPVAYCPDLGLLMLLCIGLHWEGFASGALLASLLGFAADLLTGSLLGQHALLFLCVFAGAQIASSQLNLRSIPSLVTTGAVVTLLCGSASILLSGMLVASAATAWHWRPDLLTHTLVTALATPIAVALVQRITSSLADVDAGPRAQRLTRPGRVA